MGCPMADTQIARGVSVAPNLPGLAYVTHYADSLSFSGHWVHWGAVGGSESKVYPSFAMEPWSRGR